MVFLAAALATAPYAVHLPAIVGPAPLVVQALGRASATNWSLAMEVPTLGKFHVTFKDFKVLKGSHRFDALPAPIKTEVDRLVKTLSPASHRDP